MANFEPWSLLVVGFYWVSVVGFVAGFYWVPVYCPPVAGVVVGFYWGVPVPVV